jgi:hypothetical protein
MKKLAFLMSLALAATSCASPHLEDTASLRNDELARLVAVDRQSRLIKVDDANVRSPVTGSYYLKPGQRQLQFQLQRPGATAPGKSMGGIIALDKYVTTTVDLKAGHDYLLKIDTSDIEPRVVINERPTASLLNVADNN